MTLSRTPRPIAAFHVPARGRSDLLLHFLVAAVTEANHNDIMLYTTIPNLFGGALDYQHTYIKFIITIKLCNTLMTFVHTYIHTAPLPHVMYSILIHFFQTSHIFLCHNKHIGCIGYNYTANSYSSRLQPNQPAFLTLPYHVCDQLIIIMTNVNKSNTEVKEF